MGETQTPPPIPPHPDSVTGNRHCSLQGVSSTVWDILWQALCSLHCLFGQPTQHSPQQGKGSCALTPKQSHIDCYCLLFNSSGFLWHGFKASFIRFRRQSAGTHKHLLHKHFGREEGPCCSETQPWEVSRTVRHLPKHSALHSGTLGSSGIYIQQKENKIIHHSINCILPTLKAFSA